MVFKCKCGRFKTGQPYRSNGERPWVCERCAPNRQSTSAVPAKNSETSGMHEYMSRKMAHVVK